MTDSLVKQKLVQYFNEALAMENAAVDRNQTRMSETPIPLVKQQLQYHLEQTFIQQDRLNYYHRSRESYFMVPFRVTEMPITGKNKSNELVSAITDVGELAHKLRLFLNHVKSFLFRLANDI
jgi:hypothetical protein